MITKISFPQKTNEEVNIQELIDKILSKKINWEDINKLVHDQKISENDFFKIYESSTTYRWHPPDADEPIRRSLEYAEKQEIMRFIASVIALNL